MSTRKFDRYMVAIGAGRHVKFRRLTVPERYAFFMGVLSVAAQAPVRGCLLVGSLNAEAADIAAEADVPEKVAQSALAKLRQIGVVYHDDDLGCERVHDFEEQWNPAPKHDATNAERQRRHRAKLTASRNGTVTAASNAAVTPPEVEREVEGKKAGGGGARATAPGEQVTNAVYILRQCSRLHVDRVGVENAIAAWPNGDPVQAAREVVTWATDPGFRKTNGASLLGDALSKQQQRQQRPNGRAAKADDPWSTEAILAAGEEQ